METRVGKSQCFLSSDRSPTRANGSSDRTMVTRLIVNDKENCSILIGSLAEMGRWEVKVKNSDFEPLVTRYITRRRTNSPRERSTIVWNTVVCDNQRALNRVIFNIYHHSIITLKPPDQRRHIVYVYNNRASSKVWQAPYPSDLTHWTNQLPCSPILRLIASTSHVVPWYPCWFP